MVHVTYFIQYMNVHFSVVALQLRNVCLMRIRQQFIQSNENVSFLFGFIVSAARTHWICLFFGVMRVRVRVYVRDRASVFNNK